MHLNFSPNTIRIHIFLLFLQLSLKVFIMEDQAKVIVWYHAAFLSFMLYNGNKDNQG